MADTQDNYFLWIYLLYLLGLYLALAVLVWLLEAWRHARLRKRAIRMGFKPAPLSYNKMHGVHSLLAADQLGLSAAGNSEVEAQMPILSDTTRKWLVNYLFVTTRWGPTLDIIQAVLSIVSVVLFVISTYRPLEADEPTWMIVLQTVLVVYFTLDYVLRLYLATDRVRFFFSVYTLVDFLTIAPVFLTSLAESVLRTREAEGVNRAAQSMRVLRALRILRLVRIAPSFSLQRQIFVVAVAVIAFMFIATGLYHALESRPGDLVPFHESLYYMASLVIGRPIAPTQTDSSVTTYLFLTILICLAIAIIPVLVARLVKLYFQVGNRVVYRPDLMRPHLVICGDVTTPRLAAALGQLFHSARCPADTPPVVVLHPSELDGPRRQLVDQHRYGHKVVYVPGSPLAAQDLGRAAVSFAAAVVILADFSMAPGPADAQVLAACFAVKLHNPNVRLLVQLRQQRTRHLLPAIPGWHPTDRGLCVSNLLMTLLGSGVLCVGVPSLLTNLVQQGAIQPGREGMPSGMKAAGGMWSQLHAALVKPERRWSKLVRSLGCEPDPWERGLCGGRLGAAEPGQPVPLRKNWCRSSDQARLSGPTTATLLSALGVTATPTASLAHCHPTSEFLAGVSQHLHEIPLPPGAVAMHKTFAAAARCMYLRYGVLLIAARIATSEVDSAPADLGTEPDEAAEPPAGVATQHDFNLVSHLLDKWGAARRTAAADLANAGASSAATESLIQLFPARLKMSSPNILSVFVIASGPAGAHSAVHDLTLHYGAAMMTAANYTTAVPNLSAPGPANTDEPVSSFAVSTVLGTHRLASSTGRRASPARPDQSAVVDESMLRTALYEAAGIPSQLATTIVRAESDVLVPWPWQREPGSESNSSSVTLRLSRPTQDQISRWTSHTSSLGTSSPMNYMFSPLSGGPSPFRRTAAASTTHKSQAQAAAPKLSGYPRDHILICGAGPSLTLLIRALQCAPYIPPFSQHPLFACFRGEWQASTSVGWRIVVLCPRAIWPHHTMHDARQQAAAPSTSDEVLQQVQFIDGNPIVLEDCVRAGALTARAVIIMATSQQLSVTASITDGTVPGKSAGLDSAAAAAAAATLAPIAGAAASGTFQGDSSGFAKGSAPLLQDADALLVANGLFKLNPRLHVVTQLSHGENAKYFRPVGTSLAAASKQARQYMKELLLQMRLRQLHKSLANSRSIMDKPRGRTRRGLLCGVQSMVSRRSSRRKSGKSPFHRERSRASIAAEHSTHADSDDSSECAASSYSSSQSLGANAGESDCSSPGAAPEQPAKRSPRHSSAAGTGLSRRSTHEDSDAPVGERVRAAAMAARMGVPDPSLTPSQAARLVKQVLAVKEGEASAAAEAMTKHRAHPTMLAVQQMFLPDEALEEADEGESEEASSTASESTAPPLPVTTQQSSTHSASSTQSRAPAVTMAQGPPTMLDSQASLAHVDSSEIPEVRIQPPQLPARQAEPRSPSHLHVAEGPTVGAWLAPLGQQSRRASNLKLLVKLPSTSDTVHRWTQLPAKPVPQNQLWWMVPELQEQHGAPKSYDTPGTSNQQSARSTAAHAVHRVASIQAKTALAPQATLLKQEEAISHARAGELATHTITQRNAQAAAMPGAAATKDAGRSSHSHSSRTSSRASEDAYADLTTAGHCDDARPKQHNMTYHSMPERQPGEAQANWFARAFNTAEVGSGVAQDSELFGAPSFAAGRAVSNFTMDALLLESHFNAAVLSLVKCLGKAARKQQLQLVTVQEAIAELRQRELELHGEIPNRALWPTESSWPMIEYGVLFEAMLREVGVLCMGLYRRVTPSPSMLDLPAKQARASVLPPAAMGPLAYTPELLSYVYTNPQRNVVLAPHDCLYVLRPNVDE